MWFTELMFRPFTQRHLRYFVKRNSHYQLQSLAQAERDCQTLPPKETIRQNLMQLQQLRDTRDGLHTKSQLIPPLPPVPEAPEAFRGRNPEQAVRAATLDTQVLRQLKNDQKKPLPYILGGVLAVIGVVMLAVSQLIPAAAALLLGLVCVILGANKQKKLRGQIADLQSKYRNIPEGTWEQAAESYAVTQQNYNQNLTDRQQLLADLNRQLAENEQAIAAITGSQSMAQYEENCRQQLSQYSKLEELRRNCQQAEEVLQALSNAGEQVQPPAFADKLILSSRDTEQALAQSAAEQQILQQRLGQCQGQMETLGQTESLLAQREKLQMRIETLQQYYRALTRAQETLQQATQELQRRFAPRISQRAQALFARLTGQRYQRLSLGQDLSLEASTQDETTLRGTLWRSDGTVDQLYLALRLAVAEELTPDAPLVLDDALVRFDDGRLKAALQILQEEAAHKQVILFTCQSREQGLLS